MKLLDILLEKENNNSFSEKELRLMNYLHRVFGHHTKDDLTLDMIYKYIKEHMGTNPMTTGKLADLFFNNFRKEGNYENIKNPIRESKNPFLGKIIAAKNLNDPSNAHKLFDTDDFSEEFLVRFTENGFDIINDAPSNKIISATEEIMGFDYEGDVYYYRGINSNDPIYYLEHEMENDELNYIHHYLIDESKSTLLELANIVNDNDFADKIKQDSLTDGEIIEFIEDNFPNDYNNFSTNVLNELTYSSTKSGVLALQDYIDKHITFNMNFDSEIEVEYEPFIEFLYEHPHVENFNDLTSEPLNGDNLINLSDVFYENIHNYTTQIIEDLETAIGHELSEILDKNK